MKYQIKIKINPKRGKSSWSPEENMRAMQETYQVNYSNRPATCMAHTVFKHY